MAYIVTGSLGFIILSFLDLNKKKKIHKILNLSFAIGVLMIAFSTVGILYTSNADFSLPQSIKIFLIALSILLFLIMLYGLFWALPFSKTYVAVGEKNQVIDTGVYALCRHPGVVWFAIIYMLLWLSSGIHLMLIAGIVWTTLNVLHVYFQERYFFHETIEGYGEYILKVPFLIPTRSSINKCIDTLMIKKRK